MLLTILLSTEGRLERLSEHEYHFLALKDDNGIHSYISSIFVSSTQIEAQRILIYTLSRAMSKHSGINDVRKRVFTCGSGSVTLILFLSVIPMTDHENDSRLINPRVIRSLEILIVVSGAK